MTNKTERCPRGMANFQSYHGIIDILWTDQDHQESSKPFALDRMFETCREGFFLAVLAICPVSFLQKRRVLRIRPKDEHDQAQKSSFFWGSNWPRCPSVQKVVQKA